MSWQEIGIGDIDANSPVSTTLMGKLRNDLYWIFQQFSKATLFNNTDRSVPSSGEIIQSSNQWQTVETIKVYAPDFVKSLKIRIRAKVSSGSDRQMRVREPGSGNNSDVYSFSGTDYEEMTLTLNNPATGLIDLNIQAKATFSSGNPVCFVHWSLIRGEDAK